MSAYEPRPPAPGASSMNARTRALRPPLPMSEEKAERARLLRRRRPSATLEEIAGEIGAEAEAIRQALATLRTANPQASRRTLNVSMEAWAFVRRHAHPGEPVFATVDRLFARLADLPRAG